MIPGPRPTFVYYVVVDSRLEPTTPQSFHTTRKLAREHIDSRPVELRPFLRIRRARVTLFES